MDKKNNKIALLSTVSIPKALLAMGLPTMLGMMVNAIYNIVDALFIGRLGTVQMSGITVAFPITQVVVGLGLLFGSGAGSYISRLLGQNQKEKADKTASTALYSSLCVGAIFIILTLIFLRPVLRLTGATNENISYAVSYTRIYIIFSILNIFNVTMNNIVTSEGAAKITMFALASGAVLNIGLDPIFIIVFKTGVSGAAIATAISQGVSALVYIIYILRKKSIFTFNIKHITYTKDIMSEIFKIGVPTMFFQILTSVSISLTNYQCKGYGESVIAGMGAVTRIISMLSLMIFGFLKGFQPIAGFSYGAKNFDRLHKSIKISILWSTIFCTVTGLTASLFSKPIVSFFTKNDSAMIDFGMKALRMNGLTFILFGFCTVYSSLFLALGKGRDGFILGACRQGICFIPVILLLPYIFNRNGIIFAQPVADILTTIITVFMVISLNKQLKSMQNNLTDKAM